MNIKKLFPQKKLSKKSILEFIDKKGYYFVLILCIIAVGAVAIFVSTYDITSSNDQFDTEKIIPEENQKIAMSTQTPQTGTAKTSSAIVKEGDKRTVANSSQTINQTDTKTATAAKDSELKLTMPVFGKISLDFAKDNLVYLKTLEEWGTHSGIDITSTMGSQVKATADGVVSEVKHDPRFGITVILDHQNGFKTVYANLSADDVVSTGQKIKQGEVIGAVGDTAVFESSEEVHLHFEVIKNEVPADPKKYLPKK